MERRVNIACLAIGRKWEPQAQSAFQELLAGLPKRFLVRDLGAAFEETEVLDRIELLRTDTDLLLLAVEHGSSARSITLAAVRSQVPTALWCRDADYSLASSALAADALGQLGHPYRLLHGGIAASQTELTTAASAAAAMHRLDGARIGQVGPLHLNLIGSAVDPLVLQRRFGTWVVPKALSDLRERLVGLDRKRIDEAAASLATRFSITAARPAFRKTVAFGLVLADLAREQRLDAVSIDCWQEVWPEFGVSPCLASTVGDALIACEGDIVLALTMLAGEAISGRAGYGGDLYSLDESDGTAILRHCGGSPCLHAGPGPAEIKVQAPPTPAGQKGKMVVCHPAMRPGPAVLVKLHGQELDRLHLRRCRILRTRFQGQMEVVLSIAGEAGSFRREASGNHYLVFSGDNFEAWQLWAEWSGVLAH